MTELLAAALLVLLCPVAVAAWAVSLYRSPYRSCHWCGGHGRLLGSSITLLGRCWVCDGSGRKRRAGARKVHLLLRSATASRLR
jgi:hypothetical protein